MKSFIAILSGLLFMVSSAYCFTDTDMDGVEDNKDLCPNTPLNDLVNNDGCSIQSLHTDTHYEMIVGLGYSQVNYAASIKASTLSTMLQANIYRGNESFHLSGSYYHTSVSNITQQGWNDSYIGYSTRTLPLYGVTIGINGGLILPTYKSSYDNEAIDLTGGLSFRYQIEDDISFFGGYTYTLVNDKNVPDVVTYQNTNSLYGGMNSIITPDFTMSLIYNQSDSIYADVTMAKTVGIGASYFIDSHWFSLLDYRYGLSDSTSDHDISLRLGYFF